MRAHGERAAPGATTVYGMYTAGSGTLRRPAFFVLARMPTTVNCGVPGEGGRNALPGRVRMSSRMRRPIGPSPDVHSLAAALVDHSDGVAVGDFLLGERASAQ